MFPPEGELAIDTSIYFKRELFSLTGKTVLMHNAELLNFNYAFCIVLALTLFVLRVLTDNHDFSFALDYLALVAHGFY